jgi:septum formation protein
MGERENKTAGIPLVYLASGSPRRRAVLEELGIPCQVLIVDVEEVAAATPRETVEENAGRKLLAGLRHCERGSTCNPGSAIVKAGGFGDATRDHASSERQIIVIAADTVLEARGQVLGKPADEAEARQYLQMLSGGCATAYSAVAVAVAGVAEGALATETAEVRFKTLSPEVIDWYLSTGEPMGRAGAFGIGQLGEVLTESVEGGYSCVSGLPKTALLAALASVAGGWMPESLQPVERQKKKGQRWEETTTSDLLPFSLLLFPFSRPAELTGTRAQLRPLRLRVGHVVDHGHNDQREQR